MTISEALTILQTRIGWEDDLTLEGFTLSADAKQSTSGRFFQSQHPAITLANVKACQPVVNMKDADFNKKLTSLKRDVAQKVLGDVFERDYINDDLLALYPAGFDNAMLLQMVIMVSELIFTSTRSNRIERFGDDFVGKLNYDVYREAPNKFAIRGANYLHTLGIATRYGFEIRSVQRRFGDQRNLLKTITKGADASTSREWEGHNDYNRENSADW